MTISELKTMNLQRICRERHVNKTELGRLLGATKQHGSQLLSGKSCVGDETIKKLCAAWGIEEIEFVKMEHTDDRMRILEQKIATISDMLALQGGKKETGGT